MVAASCASADKGTLRRTANTVAIVNTFQSILFMSKLRLMVKVLFGFRIRLEFWLAPTLKREDVRKLCNIEHPVRVVGSVSAVPGSGNSTRAALRCESVRTKCLSSV